MACPSGKNQKQMKLTKEERNREKINCDFWHFGSCVVTRDKGKEVCVCLWLANEKKQRETLRDKSEKPRAYETSTTI